MVYFAWPLSGFIARLVRASHRYREVTGANSVEVQEPVSRKSRKLFGPVKPFVELRPAYSVKLVFSYVVKGIEIKITAKFRASRRLRFEDTKRIMSPEMCPKRFGTFEKLATDFFRLLYAIAKIDHNCEDHSSFDLTLWACGAGNLAK